MFVKHLRLDRFGSWSDARVEGLSSGLNVIDGDGAATVSFVRAMLFGFDSHTRQSYLPSDSRGFGGAMTVSTRAGLQTISRYDDGSLDGRLTAEHDDGSLIGRQRLQELLSGVSAAAFGRLFAIDFGERPNVRELVSDAHGLGIDLLRNRNTPRLEELRLTLAERRHAIESTPSVVSTLEELRISRREISDEVRSVEERIARCDAQANARQLENEIRKLQDEIAAEQRNLQTLDAELQTRASESDERYVMQTATATQTGECDKRLHQLDVQLDRWRSMLREVIDRKQSLQTAVLSDQLPVADNQSVREHLRQLENGITALQATFGEADDDPLRSQQTRGACSARLQEMRGRVYRICHELSRSEQAAKEIASSTELEQLARCDTDLQAAIRTLVLRRRQLLAHWPHDDTVVSLPEHAQLCRCDAHPHAEPNNSVELQRTGRLDTEITELERWRDKSITTLNELEGELSEVRSRFVGIDRNLGRTLATQLARLQEERANVERDLEYVQRRHDASVEIARLEHEIEQLEAVQEHSILAEASAFLRRLSGGDYTALEITAHDTSVQDEHRRRVSWSELSDGARDQVYLALCLAVVAELKSRGVQLPVILSGAFTNVESNDVPEAAEVVHDFARQGHQVLFCTRHEHVVNVFRILNAPLHKTASSVLQEPAAAPAPIPADDIAPAEAAQSSSSSAFFLHETCPIEDAPAVDEANAVRLRKIGIWTVGDLMAVDSLDAAGRLQYAGVTLELVRSWKSQTLLLCRVPHLRPYDARLLVACGVTDPEQLRRMQPGQVREIVQRFAGSSRGQALMMSGTEFELSRVTNWIKETDESNRKRSAETRSQSTSSRSTQASHRSSARTSRLSSRQSSATGSRARERSSSSRREQARSVLKFDESSLRFYLDTADDVVDAPSIGPRTAERLVGVGVRSVADLLQADPGDLARRLQHSRTTADTICQWQQQTSLACRIPQLRGHDAQILVALGITDPHELARQDAQELWNKIAPFVATSQGKRIIRNGTAPDLQEISDWISWASAARTLAAA